MDLIIKMSPGLEPPAFLLRSDSNNLYTAQGMNGSHPQASMSPPITPVTLDISSVTNTNLSFYDTFNHNAMALNSAKAVTSVNWGMLGLTVIIVCTAVGNLLVCLAVCWEKRLQNMTNYFLMSLAIADFLVSLLVMPLGMVVEVFGHFPMSPEMCVLWVSSDVLMCSASIWHMCTMSMDRYFTLNYPLRYGRNKTRRMVAGKILFVWVVSMSIALPICIYGFVDSTIVYNDGACVPVLKSFIIMGSIFAFYIPLLIMLVTYILTIRILWRNQQHMKQVDRSGLKPRLAQLTAQCTGFAIPKLVAALKKPARVTRKPIGAFLSSKHHHSHHNAPSLSDSGVTNHAQRTLEHISSNLNKKWSSLPTFEDSKLLNLESQNTVHAKAANSCRHTYDKLKLCDEMLKSYRDKPGIEKTLKYIGLQHLRPPSSLGHSGVFESPVSSLSTMESTLHSPCTYSDCGDVWKEHDVDKSPGKRSNRSKQFKPPTSLSCHSFSTYLCLKSSDNSLMTSEFCSNLQNEKDTLDNCSQTQQNRLDQGQRYNHENQEINHLKDQYYYQLRETNHNTNDSKCISSNVGFSNNNVAQHEKSSLVIPSAPNTILMKYNYRTSFPSSVSTPLISVSHESDVEDSLSAKNHAYLEDGALEHLPGQTVNKKYPNSDSCSISSASNLIRSKSEIHKSTGSNFTQENGDKFENRRHSSKDSTRRKRFSKRSKKDRKPSEPQQALNCPNSDPLKRNVTQLPKYNKQPRPTDGFLRVPTQHIPWCVQNPDKQTCRFGGLTAAHSDTNIAHSGKAGQFGCREGHGRCGLDGVCFCSIPLDNRRPELDYQSMEWGRRYFQIQDEMDRCLSGELTDSSISGEDHTSDLVTRPSLKPLDISDKNPRSGVIDLNQSASTPPSVRRRLPTSPTSPLLLSLTASTNDNGSDYAEEDNRSVGFEKEDNGYVEIIESTSSSSASNGRDVDLVEGLGICLSREDSVEGHEGDNDDDEDSEDENDEDKKSASNSNSIEISISSKLLGSNDFPQEENYTPDFSSTDGLLAEGDSVSLVRSHAIENSGLESRNPSPCVTVCLQPPSPKSNPTFLHSGNDLSSDLYVYREEDGLQLCSKPAFYNNAGCNIKENRTVCSSDHNHGEAGNCEKVLDKYQTRSLSVTTRDSKRSEIDGTQRHHCLTNSENGAKKIRDDIDSDKFNIPNQALSSSRYSSMWQGSHLSATPANINTTSVQSPRHIKDTLSFPLRSSYSALNGEPVISSDGEMTYEETDDTLDSEHNSNTLKLRRPRTHLAHSRYMKRQQSRSTAARNYESTGKLVAKKKRPSFKNTLLRIHRGRLPADTTQSFGGKNKHFLSKKTASNERKASKVLGIIFMVFVTLWTPFFAVNILSATCESCITGVTEEMMALFLWMGYIASLANPIIYTMFNTAFRRTFIRILTCKIRRRCGSGGVYGGAARSTNDGGGTTGYNYMSYTTMVASERRSTMTALLKDESR